VSGIVTAVAIFFLARFASNLLDGFFERVKTGQTRLSWLDGDLAMPTRRVAKVSLWLLALAMAYPYLPGAHTEAFKGVSVMVGLMISLSASNLVGQAGAGLKPPCRTSIPSTGWSAGRSPANCARARA
jgi:hypothetical protein